MKDLSIEYAIWLRENCTMDIYNAFTYLETGKLYYIDSVRDMNTLYQFFYEERF